MLGYFTGSVTQCQWSPLIIHVSDAELYLLIFFFLRCACFKPVCTVILGLHSRGPALLTLMETFLAGRTNQMMRSGKVALRATNQRMRRRNDITRMKKERTLTTRGRGTESQVLPESGIKIWGRFVHEMDHEPTVCVNLNTLDFVEAD